MGNSNVVSITYRATQQDAEELRRRAAARGLSVQAYMDRQLALDRDEVEQRLRAVIATGYARIQHDPEFDALDAELAARPRSLPSELGFNPEAQARHAA
jgi:hypothetical protein